MGGPDWVGRGGGDPEEGTQTQKKWSPKGNASAQKVLTTKGETQQATRPPRKCRRPKEKNNRQHVRPGSVDDPEGEGTQKVKARKAQKRGGPKGGRPQISRLFSLSRSMFALFPPLVVADRAFESEFFGVLAEGGPAQGVLAEGVRAEGGPGGGGS